MFQQQCKIEEEEYRLKVATGDYSTQNDNTALPTSTKRRRFVKDAYFSDEEVQAEDD
jgi:hypothetical protein